MQNYGCGHKTCANLAKQGASKCAAVFALLKYNYNLPHPKAGTSEWVFGLGKELGGSYAGQYNLCAGGHEPADYVLGDFCWIRCAMREFREEFKIDCDFKRFDLMFRSAKSKRIRVFMHHQTPVFIAILDTGTSRHTIKNQMQQDNINPMLTYSYKEMCDFEYFRLTDCSQLEYKNLPVSSFAEGIRKKIDINQI